MSTVRSGTNIKRDKFLFAVRIFIERRFRFNLQQRVPVQTLVSAENKGISPRKKGLRLGGQLLLLGLIIVPIIMLIQDMLRMNNSPIVAIIAILTFWGGILRMIYARIFESNEPGEDNSETGIFSSVQKILNKKQTASALPPEHSTAADSYISPSTNNWRETNDLPSQSVIDHTTKLLDKDK